MAEVARIILHWIFGIVGVLLCYSAFFLYKDEEGKLENAMQKWWERCYALKVGTVTREAAFMKGVVEIASSGINKFFGQSLFTVRAVLVSCCFSVTSTSFSIALVTLFSSRCDASQKQVVLPCLMCGSIFLFLVFLRSRLQDKWSGIWSIVACALIGAFLLLSIPISNTLRLMTNFWVLLPSLCMAIISDITFITFTRWILIKADNSQSFRKITLLIVCNIFLSCVLILIPFVLSIKYNTAYNVEMCMQGYPDKYEWGYDLEQPYLQPYLSLSTNIMDLAPYRLVRFNHELWFVFGFIAFSNCFDVLCSAAFIIIGAGLLVHRLIWPFIERPIYAIYRHKIFSEQKNWFFLLVWGVFVWRGQALEST
jgi:hypothetical protein